MFCKYCGEEIRDEAVVCPKCGCPTVDKNKAVSANGISGNGEDAPNMGMAVLGFFIPVVGLILWAMWKDQTPLKAKSAGKGALIGFIVSMVFGILYGIIIGTMLY